MSIYHIHHIVPKHLGGSDDPSNLIKLTVNEHAEAHKKLWEDHGNEYDYIAWKCLSGQISNAEANRLANIHYHKGRKLTEEVKKKISQRISGEKHPLYGIGHTEETKKKISEKTKEGMRKSDKKAGAPKGTVPWNKGKTGLQKHSEETRKKIGESVSETRHKKSGGDFSPPP